MGKVIEIESYEDIPEYTGLSNTKSIEVKDNCGMDMLMLLV